ncbi:MAG: hypothetical protein HDR18_09155 [Lachnospiraceae bacterium]|nr:hypothetical protein [Lachnospiraceae bacterium]
MLSVVIIWIYMFFTTFLIGYGILCLLMRFVPYRIRHMDSYLICGLAGVTVYAQFFSLFGRVGLVANLLLCMTCIAIAWCLRRQLGCMLSETWNNIRENRLGERGKMLGILFLFFLFAYGASRGIIHYDTGLYHAQSIRWLEEYSAVKGLGNLHCRLAYNSSSFALSALYSMAFLGGQSYHCAAGFLAWILAKVCLEVIGALRKRRLHTSDFARTMGIYYLVIIFDEMVSPASDYFMVLLAFYIVIRFLELAESEVKEILPYALLCVLGVFLMTVKLSAALILLLVIYPAYYLIRGNRWKDTAVYLALGIVTALPFFIRNVLLSGWLVYPFTQIDLFHVAWKIPKGMADYDAKEIQVWGRGYTDVTRYDISAREWLPDWFRSLAGSDKLLVAAAVVSLIVLFVYGIGMLCGWRRRRPGILIVQMTVACSFIFWLFTSPLIRYGCVYVYLMPAVVIGGVYDAILTRTEERSGQRKGVKVYSQSGADAWKNGANAMKCAAEPVSVKVFRLCGMMAVMFLLIYKCAALGKEIVVSYRNDYWIAQKDYENYETQSYEINGVTFYYPVNGDQVGYEAFPSAPAKTELRFLGEGIEDGFVSVLSY